MSDISFDHVPAGAIASNTYIEQAFKRASLGGLVIPQKVAVIGQYSSGKAPTDYVAKQVTSADQAGSLYGFGSMLHIIIAALFAANGSFDVFAFPIPDEGGAAAAEGSVSVTGDATGAGTIALYIAGKRVAVAVANGDTDEEIADAIVAAINANPNLPVTAAENGTTPTQVDITAKWAGDTSNDISIDIDLLVGDDLNEPSGPTIAITEMSGGATDPDPQTAFDNFGDTFYTWVVYPYQGASQLTVLETEGANRIDPAVKRPFAGVIGYTDTMSNYLTFLDSHNSPWLTTMPVEGSPNMQLEIAAATVAECARSAQADPARPFKNLRLRGILPGSGAEWTLAQKETVEAAGGSAFRIGANGSVLIHDLLTTYTENPLGAADDSWRYTVTVTNVQAKLYSLDNVFNSEPFTQAKVVDDAAITAQPYAIRPKTVRAYVRRLVDELWIPQAWSRERDAIVDSISAQINTGNAGRIDVQLTDVVAMGLRIVAVKYQWSFFAAS
ncbi:MAG: hypothetical protein ACOC2N_00060 [Spirochaetota bacterium]